MAMASASNQDLFMCPICLDLLKDPVTILCGHNYCMSCIQGFWNQEDLKLIYSCPQCRETFTPRPVLRKNMAFAELVEQVRKTNIEEGCHEDFVGPGDVECHVCAEKKYKAVKSCLDCQRSYCETHVKLHNELYPGDEHLVVDVTCQAEDRVCCRHNKELEIFCRTDQTCICYLCSMDEHKGHDTIAAAAEWTNKKKQLAETQRGFQQRIQEREKELQQLKRTVDNLKSSAQTAVNHSVRIFTEMMRSIEKRRSEVTQLIRAQEKAEVSRAEGLLEKLEQEIAELKRTDAELEQLSHTQDHIHYIKKVQSVKQTPHSKDFPRICFSQNVSFETVKKSVSTLRLQLEKKLLEIFKQEQGKVTKAESNGLLTKRKTLVVYQAAPPEIVNRQDFLQYSCRFTLDPNTANKLHLSERYRRVQYTNEHQNNPDHPDRFDRWCQQVLCREGVSGRCYWEVEWSGNVDIAVSYKGINRKGGSDCRFGCNDQSWRLNLSSASCFYRHSYKQTNLPLVADSRIGVYVDDEAGTLAFYRISDTMSLLHRVYTTFTDTLYPGFGCWGEGASVKLL